MIPAKNKGAEELADHIRTRYMTHDPLPKQLSTITLNSFFCEAVRDMYEQTAPDDAHRMSEHIIQRTIGSHAERHSGIETVTSNLVHIRMDRIESDQDAQNVFRQVLLSVIMFDMYDGRPARMFPADLDDETIQRIETLTEDTPVDIRTAHINLIGFCIIFTSYYRQLCDGDISHMTQHIDILYREETDISIDAEVKTFLDNYLKLGPKRLEAFRRTLRLTCWYYEPKHHIYMDMQQVCSTFT